MKTSIGLGVVAVWTAIGLGISGCGSDSATSTSATSSTASGSYASTSPHTTSAKGAETTSASAPNPTIADYVNRNGISETTVKKGDLNAPVINLPIPPGWQSSAPQEAPASAYDAMAYTAVKFDQGPPTIVAHMSWLNGNVDPKKILELAPGEIRNLPGYEAGNAGGPSTLGDHPAFVLGGTYVREGATRVVAQKTVVITAADGLYVLRITVDGPEAAGDVMVEATDQIDSDTTIG